MLITYFLLFIYEVNPAQKHEKLKTLLKTQPVTAVQKIE